MSAMIVIGCRSWHNGRQTRVIAGVKSRAEFCRLTGITPYEAKGYSSQTWNPVEVATATAYPGIALYHVEEYSNEFVTSDGRLIVLDRPSGT